MFADEYSAKRLDGQNDPILVAMEARRASGLQVNGKEPKREIEPIGRKTPMTSKRKFNPKEKPFDFSQPVFEPPTHPVDIPDKDIEEDDSEV
jgi:hypothetical protein